MAITILQATDEQIKQQIRYAMVIVGLKNIPTPTEADVMLRFLRNTFPQYTIDEIRIAFDYGASGKLDTDITCYENFSTLYISQILRSYARYKAKEIKDKPVILEEIKLIENKKTDSIMNEWLTNTKDWVKSNRIRWELMPIDLYDYLKKNGKISLSWLDIRASAMEHMISLKYQRHPNSDEFSKLFDENIIMAQEVDNVLNIAKKKRLFKYLQDEI